MKNIFAVTIGVLLSVLVGSLFMSISKPDEEVGKYVNADNNTKAFQVAAYNTYETALEEAKNKNGIVVKDGEYYCVYIAVLKDSSNISKMIDYLNNNNTYYYIKNIDLNASLEENLVKYEELMKNSSSDVAFLKLNEQILKTIGDNNEN